MSCRTRLLALAAAAALSGGVYALAEQPADIASESQFSLAQPVYLQTTEPASTRKPLMALLNEAGLAKPLEDWGINVYGYVQGGYFYDTSSPQSGDGPTFINFNGFKNTGILDQIDLTGERTVDATKKQFDIGFRLEAIWGTDAAFIHSNGLADDQSDRYQWDPVQLYVDVTTPGLPLRIRMGKWIELAGFEQFSANIYNAFGDPSKSFYSHSYQFFYAEPGTQTGILGTYVLNTQWTFDAGITRGWNQSVDDSNGSADFVGRVTFIPSDKTTVIFNTTLGPEFSTGFGDNLPPGDNGNWWTYLDLVLTHKLTDNLSIGSGIDYVDAPHIPGLTGAQQFGGVAGYLSYVLDPHVTLNTRLEWYADTSGFSTGTTFGYINFYEATLGLAIKPAAQSSLLSSLLFRPEIRYDYSDRPAFDSGDNNQFTFSVDVLYQF